MSTTISILVSVVILLLLLISFYNRLVKLRNNRENAFADIDVQLKQRHDLIPQLLETVKGYMKHEEKVLINVTAARSGAINASTISEKIAAENQLTSALSGLNIAVEAYPDLKASANFAALQDELATTENKVAFSRQFYNDNVRELNTAIKTIPTNFFAGFAKVSEREFYEVADPQDREVPNVKF